MLNSLTHEQQSCFEFSTKELVFLMFPVGWMVYGCKFYEKAFKRQKSQQFDLQALLTAKLNSA